MAQEAKETSILMLCSWGEEYISQNLTTIPNSDRTKGRLAREWSRAKLWVWETEVSYSFV